MMHERKIDKRKILYMVLAIAVAMGIWFYVDEANNETASVTITDIPIEYIGKDTTLADRGLMLVEGEDSGTDATVDITFEGTRRLVTSLDRTKIRVTADLSYITSAGRQTVTLQTSFTDRRFTSGIRINEYSSEKASINIGELNRKNVELRCEVIGNVAEGYSAGQLQMSMETLEILGQSEDLASVSYAKVNLDIGTDAKETIHAELPYELYDSNDQLIENNRIHAQAETIEVTLPIYVTKELPLVMDFIEAPGARLEDMVWDIQPKTITVSGDASVLNDVDSIVLDTFSLLNVGNEVSSHSYSIIIPSGCENLSGVTRATLEIAFPERSVSQISTSNISFTNRPDGKNIELLTEQVTVSIFGSADDVAAISGEQLSLVVDLTDYAGAEGTYTIPATVQLRSGQDVGISGSYQIRVRITNESEEEESGAPLDGTEAGI